jgi:DNA-binding CsgD family transcriptional regulator
MAGHLPQLDREALRRLRETVRTLKGFRRALPIRELLAAAGTAPPGPGITVDFEATRDLGEPLIVIRMPSAAATPVPDARLAALSPREREVAELVAQGLSNKLIADRLHLATSTVKDHVHRIFEKTGFANRAAIAAACRGPLTP